MKGARRKCRAKTKSNLGDTPKNKKKRKEKNSQCPGKAGTDLAGAYRLLYMCENIKERHSIT